MPGSVDAGGRAIAEPGSGLDLARCPVAKTRNLWVNVSPHARLRRDCAILLRSQLQRREAHMALNDREIAVVKGMLFRGDRQHDIAACFGINDGQHC
jgi:hypothetical protein